MNVCVPSGNNLTRRVISESSVFWNITPYSPLEVNRHFEGDILLPSVDWPSVGYKALYISEERTLHRILHSSKLHYRFQKNSLLVSVLSQKNPVLILLSYFLEILFNIILTSMSRSSHWYVLNCGRITSVTYWVQMKLMMLGRFKYE